MSIGDTSAAEVQQTASPAGAQGRSASRQRTRDSLLGTIGIFYALVVALWTYRFWGTLHEAAPVLDMFRTEHGPGQMTLEDWKASGASDIFCPHPGGDPSKNRIGRYIDADGIYAPTLFVFGLPTMLGGAFLGLLNASCGHRWVARMIGATMAASVFVIVFYSGDIAALTNITE